MARARSRMAIASACCWGADKLGLLGQSILATVDTQAARNSRGAAGAFSSTDGGTGARATGGLAGGLGVGLTTGVVVVQLATRPPSVSAPATLASVKARFFKLGCKTNPQ